MGRGGAKLGPGPGWAGVKEGREGLEVGRFKAKAGLERRGQKVERGTVRGATCVEQSLSRAKAEREALGTEQRDGMWQGENRGRG